MNGKKCEFEVDRFVYSFFCYIAASSSSIALWNVRSSTLTLKRAFKIASLLTVQINRVHIAYPVCGNITCGGL